MSHPQNPEKIMVIDGVEYVGQDRTGKPRFYMDGSPVRENGQMQCKAKSHWSGYRCIRYSTTKYPVCQQHGAGSPKAGRPGGGPVTTGTFTSDLPSDLGTRNEKALSDPNLMSLRDQIAFVQARTTRLMSMLKDEGELAVYIEDLIEGVKMYKSGIAQDDERMMVRGLAKLEGSVGTVDADIMQNNSIIDLMERQSKLMVQDAKLRKSLNVTLSVEEAMAMILLVKTIVNEFVKDPTVRVKIAQELRKNFQIMDSTPTEPRVVEPRVVEGRPLN